MRSVHNLISGFERDELCSVRILFSIYNLLGMTREGVNLLANLFGTKGNVEKPETMKEVVTTPSAQPHVLREKMMEKSMSHGTTVKANLSPVRLEAAFGKMHLYFCPMRELEVLEKIDTGDGAEIPEKVVVDGLNIPSGNKSGLYTLRNVKITSNGSIQVMADKDTTWEMVQ